MVRRGSHLHEGAATNPKHKLDWKTRLAVVSILVVLPVVGFIVGDYVGDATCEPEGGFLGGLECIDRGVRGGLLGFVVGLIAAGLLVLGRLRRRSRVDAAKARS